MTIITTDAVREALIKVCTENPNKVNPTGVNPEGDSVCLYDDGHGNRCIAGEAVFVLTGVSIPGSVFTAVSSLLNSADALRNEGILDLGEFEFEEHARVLLGEVQLRADGQFGSSDGNPHPITWGEVLTELTEGQDT